MQPQELFDIYKKAGAMLSGHFVLSSGLHSPTYLQSALALHNPKDAAKIGKALADKISQQIDIDNVDMVISPAMGGLLIGYEVARNLGKPYIFCERVEGQFTIRRGFAIPPQSNLIIIEDIVTTGKSSLETIDCVEEFGGKVVAEGCIINRNPNGKPLGDTPLISIAELEVPSYKEADLPAEIAALPITKPGSRFIQK